MEPRLYYPCMQTSTIMVNGQELLLDGEGYLLDLDAWTEEFAIIRAQEETLALNDEHWEVKGNGLKIKPAPEWSGLMK